MARQELLLQCNNNNHNNSSSNNGTNSNKNCRADVNRNTIHSPSSSSSSSRNPHHMQHQASHQQQPLLQQSHSKRKVRKEKKSVKKQQRFVWKNLSRVLNRSRHGHGSVCNYAALHEEDSRSPQPASTGFSCDVNGNYCPVDQIDWRCLRINGSSGQECETIENSNAFLSSSTSTTTAGATNTTPHRHLQHRHTKNCMDDITDSSTCSDDCTTIIDQRNGNQVSDSDVRLRELQQRKLELQIEYYDNMNRMRPQIERVMEKLESFLDQKSQKRKASDDLNFLH